ncbi:MAG: Hsp20/alpha crystallin family protein [Candidatus Atribacteria bacterium]|nr:Hsp20/alpha crystallin family protein [Candidatus Atribacteria bacterium]
MEDQDQKEKLKELEEKFKKLEAKDKEEEAEGVAGSVVRGLGKFIPGLGDITKELEKSEAFKERLRVINKEVDRQLKVTPLKKIDSKEGRRTIIPPRTTVGNPRPSSKTKNSALKQQKEVMIDIFDEGDYLKIIAELPGVAEQDIKTEVKGNVLTISAQGNLREYYKEVNLPYPVKQELYLSYKNGILQIKAIKA